MDYIQWQMWILKAGMGFNCTFVILVKILNQYVLWSKIIYIKYTVITKNSDTFFLNRIQIKLNLQVFRFYLKYILTIFLIECP